MLSLIIVGNLGCIAPAPSDDKGVAILGPLVEIDTRAPARSAAVVARVERPAVRPVEAARRPIARDPARVRDLVAAAKLARLNATNRAGDNAAAARPPHDLWGTGLDSKAQRALHRAASAKYRECRRRVRRLAGVDCKQQGRHARRSVLETRAAKLRRERVNAPSSAVGEISLTGMNNASIPLRVCEALSSKGNASATIARRCLVAACSDRSRDSVARYASRLSAAARARIANLGSCSPYHDVLAPGRD